jgi:hypothetical protein
MILQAKWVWKSESAERIRWNSVFLLEKSSVNALMRRLIAIGPTLNGILPNISSDKTPNGERPLEERDRPYARFPPNDWETMRPMSGPDDVVEPWSARRKVTRGMDIIHGTPPRHGA